MLVAAQQRISKKLKKFKNFSAQLPHLLPIQSEGVLLCLPPFLENRISGNGIRQLTGGLREGG